MPRYIAKYIPETDLGDFTCDHCNKGGRAEDCAENSEGTVFLHDDCVSEWESANDTLFIHRDESAS